ncbi:MAG TPA: hypothetical protein PLZ43_14845, partial [bacterium]|nr:hypothetical protein [bacterium]
VENIIYANDSVFSLKFKAFPNDSGDLTIDLVELFGDVEVQSLSDINEEGDYTAKIKFPVVADGEKSIGIRAVDNAENTGTATLQAIKDTIQPLIVNLGNTLPANVTTPLTVSYAVTEINPLDSFYTVTPAGDAVTVWTSLNPAILAGDITVTDSLLDEDGAYTLHFKSVDKAGNEKVQTKTLSFDRIIPTATFTTMPEINENGFIAQNSIAITIIATDNLTGETELIHEFFNGTTWVENPEEPKNIWNNFLLQNQLYDKKYRVKDLAGNKSADINVSFTVDTVFPELTTNKTALESRAYNISDINLMLNSTCTDTNLLNYTYSINSSEEVIYTSPSTSLTNDLSFIEGYNTIVVKCTDKAGNLTEETINLVIDNTPPIPSFVSVPSNAAPMCGINKTLEVSGSDANDIKQASYWYQIDSGTISAFYSSTLNDTNEADLYYPAPSDTVFSNVALYKNKISGVSFYYALEDEAGNVSEPIVTDWFVDGKPPVGSVIYVNDHAVGFIPPNARTYTGQELDDKFEEFGDDYGKMRNWISDQFSDISKVYLYENNTLRNTYTNADFYDEEGTGTPCTVYFFSADTDVYFLTIYCAFNYVSDQFTYKVLFEDDCGNKGDLTDCKDDNYYCVSRSVNTSSPPLSLNVLQTKAEEYKLTISAQGANITYCNITGPNKNYSCQLKQGDQFIATDTPTPWESGSYTVTVRSKYSDGSTVSQVQQTFVIDRTAFSISFNNITTSSVSFITPPTLSYNIAIASAVKEAKFYFRGRTINYKYVPAGQAGSYTDTGEGLYANSSYQKLIYTATKNSGSFSLAIDAEGGIYDRIYYEITPNFGVIKTGEFTLAKKVKYIKQNSQDLRAWYEGGNIIAFKESIVSKKIKNSDVISQNTSLHDTLCTIEDRPFYNYEETKTTLKTTTLVADDYNTTEITPAKVKYKYVSNNSCNSMSNCAFSSAGCQNIKVGSSAKFCTGSTSYHYSEGSYIGGYSCSEWEAPSSSGQYAVPLYQVYCPFYRDMQYIPSGMSLRINDSERQKTFIVKNFLVTKMSSDCF